MSTSLNAMYSTSKVQMVQATSPENGYHVKRESMRLLSGKLLKHVKKLTISERKEKNKSMEKELAIVSPEHI